VPYLGVDCIHGKQCPVILGPVILGYSQSSLFIGLTLPSGRGGLYNVIIVLITTGMQYMTIQK